MSLENTVAFANKCHDGIAHAVLNLKFKQDSLPPANIVFLLTLIELYGALITVIEKPRYVAVEVIFRSFLESYIDLLNLDQDNTGKFKSSLLLSYYKSEAQKLSLAEGGNVFLSKIASSANFKSRLESAKKEKEKLIEAGARVLTISDKFKNVGKEEEYNAIYKHLCNSTHGSNIALDNRHIEKSESGQVSLVLYRENDPDVTSAMLDTATQFLIDAAKICLESTSGSESETIKDLHTEYTKMNTKD